MKKHVRYTCRSCGNVMQCRCVGGRYDRFVGSCIECDEDVTYVPPLCLSEDSKARNAGEDPEQAVEFYPSSSNWLSFSANPDRSFSTMTGIPESEVREARRSPRPRFSIPKTVDEFYEFAHEKVNYRSVQAGLITAEGAWHASLQPEYKAWPSAIMALAATKIEIGCEHLRFPFPAISIRLPEDYVQESGGPVIRTLMATIIRNSEDGSFATTSLDGVMPPRGRFLEGIRWRNLDRKVPAILLVATKWSEDGQGDDSFGLFSIALEKGVRLDESFKRLDWDRRTREGDPNYKFGTNYVPSERMMREMLSLVVGTAFLATSRVKRDKPIVTPDKKPRPERRQFEKEHGGKEQPCFNVGRDLVLPRAQGVPTATEAGEVGPGEGTGRHLRYGHFRTGFLRFQPFGRRDEPRYELIFIEPTIVREDLPLRPRTTPSSVRDLRDVRDVTQPRPPEED